MGRISLESAANYDDLGVGTNCFYCESDKVKGYDYTPRKDQLVPGERGIRVRACLNCLPRIHYHTVVKGRLLSLQEKQKILAPRGDVSTGRQTSFGRFEVIDGVLVPSRMSSFLDGQGRPSQFFLDTEHGPIDQINMAELEEAQLCIGATLLGIRSKKLDEAWSDLQGRISPGAFEAIRKRLVESP